MGTRTRSQRPRSAAARSAGAPSSHGFTLVELMILVAILGTLAAIAIPFYRGYQKRARINAAITDIQSIQTTIAAHEGAMGGLPVSLAALDLNTTLDPWGHPYRYQRLDLVPSGQWRKDKNLVPINSTYDLWSMGPDGLTAVALTAAASLDDIIRANDGSFVGLASDY